MHTSAFLSQYLLFISLHIEMLPGAVKRSMWCNSIKTWRPIRCRKNRSLGEYTQKFPKKEVTLFCQFPSISWKNIKIIKKNIYILSATKLSYRHEMITDKRTKDTKRTWYYLKCLTRKTLALVYASHGQSIRVLSFRVFKNSL